jgi:hypothetical protein
MSHKRLKKAVKKVSSVGVRRVPSAFDDDAFVETDNLKGVFLWPLFNFQDNCPSGSENEFVDVDSFSDAAPEVHKETVPASADESTIAADAAAPPEAPVAAEASTADVSQPALSRDEASPEFAKELELTVQRGGGESYRTRSPGRSSGGCSRISNSLSLFGRFQQELRYVSSWQITKCWLQDHWHLEQDF